MNIDKHHERLKESLDVIEESIKIGLIKRQRNIGFNTSAAASDMLEIFLHKENLIDPGFVVKYEWFNSKNKVEEKFSFPFKDKELILDLMAFIENKRNSLCYGVPKPEDEVRNLLEKFNQLKQTFRQLGVKIE